MADKLTEWLVYLHYYLSDQRGVDIGASEASDFLVPWLTDTGEKLRGFYPTNLGIILKKLGCSKREKHRHFL